MKTLYAIILNYNGYDNTVSCLKSILRCRMPQGFNVKFLVVDNASEDGSGEKLKKNFPKILVLINKKNLGYSEGNNIGIKYALSKNAQLILIINNDTVLLRDSIFNLINGMRQRDFDVVCPKIYFEKGFEFHKDRYRKEDLGKIIWYAGGEMDWNNVIGYHRGVDQVDRGQFDNFRNTQFITGACFLSKAEVFKKVGLFDKRYFLYYEDADLSIRIQRSGFKIGFIPESFIYHKNAGSSHSGSLLQDYFITRNRLLFGFAYAPLKSKIALFKESIRILINGRKWQKKGVYDFYTRKLGKGTFPIL